MRFMDYPIVKVTTVDGYPLHGALSENTKNKKNILIHFHGSAGNFYSHSYLAVLARAANQLNWAYLSTNNRGSYVYELELGTKASGAAIEIFEECLRDIDAWIEFALARGYENIILEGHSFGTNKVQYCALRGKYRSKIKALILLGFNDAFGTQLQYLAGIHQKTRII